MDSKRGWAQAAVVVVLGLLGGCTALQGGKIVSEGRGSLVYRTPSAGTVAVVDTSIGKQLYQGKVARDTLVEMDPFSGEVVVDNRVVARPLTGTADEYRIMFKAAPEEPAARPMGEAEPATMPATEPMEAPASMPATATAPAE